MFDQKHENEKKGTMEKLLAYVNIYFPNKIKREVFFLSQFFSFDKGHA